MSVALRKRAACISARDPHVCFPPNRLASAWAGADRLPDRRVMKKIETHHPKVPWSWVGSMIFPWASLTYFGLCSGAPLTFTIRKLVESPALVAFLASINYMLVFLVSGIASYMSDRIWTRWGRRRPLLIVGWIGGAVAMFFVPLAEDVWTLAALIVVFQLCSDVGSPYEPLYNEVIPPAQRGRASTMRNIMQQMTSLFFNGVMLAQFDKKYDLGKTGDWLQLNGEKAIYWVGCVVVAAAALFLAFKVRETPPPQSIVRERFSPLRFVRDVFGQRQQWMIYTLYVCPILVVAGVGTFGSSPVGAFVTLFQAEQLGFSKQQIGWSAGLVGIINMVLFVPVWGYLADRLPRLQMFRFALLAPIVVNFTFFLIVRFVADYAVPYPALLAVAIMSEGLMSMIYVLWGPLVYDYLPSNAYGTAAAGFSFVGGLMTFLLMNGAGMWVQGFTRVFGTAGPSAYDYSSAFIWQAVGAAIAFGLASFFAREVKRGRVIAHARLEFEAAKAKDGAGASGSTSN